MLLPLLPTAPGFALNVGVLWLALCWFAFQRAALFRATVLAHEKRPISASLRPLDIYIYVFGSQSCATRLVFVGSARLRPKTKPRMAPSGTGLTAHAFVSTVRSAILRRRNTAFSSRLRPVAHHANCRRAVPLRLLLTHAPLARPSAMALFPS